MDLYPHHADAIGAAYYWGGYTREMARATIWEEDVENGALESEHLRLAVGIHGCSLEDSRDRLLLKLLGRGVSPERALGLRIGGLDVDGNEKLYDVSGGPGCRVPLVQLDDCDGVDDFWTLVRASESLDGFLFAEVCNATPYGRRPLIEEDLEQILDRNSMPFQTKPYGTTGSEAKQPAA